MKKAHPFSFKSLKSAISLFLALVLILLAIPGFAVSVQAANNGLSTYPLTISYTGTGGTMIGTTQHAADEVITINAGTNDGYNFNGWTVAPAGAVTFEDASAASTTFTMPRQGITVTATWARIILQPNITTTSLSNGSINVSYSATINATGSLPIAWSITSGNLPHGLSLNAATGIISGTPTQAGSFTFTVRAANDGGFDEQELSIIVHAATTPEYGLFTLTLRAGSGGSVSIDGGSFGSTRTERFRPGQRVDITARADRDYDFDRWSYSSGEVLHEFRRDTTFIMPNRDVTVWADFTYYRDDWRGWDRDDWRWGNHSPLPRHEPRSQAPPAQSPLRVGSRQQNIPTADTANFTFSFPGIPDGRHPVSISGLPAGITAPSHASSQNSELQVQLTGISRAAAGAYTLILVLYDNNGNAITSPTLFTLATTGSQYGPSHVTELRLTIGSTFYLHNGLVFSGAAPFADPVNNNVMVPLRIIAESLGARVTWVGETNTVHVFNDTSHYFFIIDVPLTNNMGTPVIVDGNTFVPIEFVSDILAADVTWDAVNQAVYIRH